MLKKRSMGDLNGVLLQSFPLACWKSANFPLHAVPCPTYSRRMPLGLSAGIYTNKAEVVSLPRRQHASFRLVRDFCVLPVQTTPQTAGELASIIVRVPRLDWG